MKTFTPGDDVGNSAGRIGASFQDNLFTARTSYVTIEEGFHNDFGFYASRIDPKDRSSDRRPPPAHPWTDPADLSTV